MHEEDEKDGTLPRSSGSDEQSTAPAKHDTEIDDIQSQSHASSIVGEDEEKHADEEVRPPPHRQSTDLGPAIVVPRLNRRGLFGQFTLVAEIENPKTYPRKMKWFITFIVAVAAAAAPSGSAIFFRWLILSWFDVELKLMNFGQPRFLR